MVTAETWFLVIVGSLGGLILILTCVIIILCIVWKRKSCLRKQEDARKEQEKFNADNLTPIEAHSVPMNYDNNSNWVLKERTSHEVYSPGSLTRPIATGNEPFIIRSSLVKYSQQLDKGNVPQPSYPQASTTWHQNSNDQWNRGGLTSQTHLNADTPTKAEQKMVQLGMIAKRPHELNGHLSSFSNDDALRAKSSKAKDAKRRSKDLEEDKVYHGEVLSPGTEVQLWPMAAATSPTPFTLPREDYNTEGVTWYSKPSKGVSTSPSFETSPNYARYGSSQNVSVPNGSHVAKYTEPVPSHSFTTSSGEQSPESRSHSKVERINRIKRIGVPILPD